MGFNINHRFYFSYLTKQSLYLVTGLATIILGCKEDLLSVPGLRLWLTLPKTTYLLLSTPIHPCAFCYLVKTFFFPQEFNLPRARLSVNCTFVLKTFICCDSFLVLLHLLGF